MSINTHIEFCNVCGHRVTVAIPAGDNRERHICVNCGEIQYQNPKIVTGCIPVADERILLCKRAIEPRKGYWTVPAGFMENGETVLEGAVRETMEEACAPVTNLQLFGVFNLPRISQVYMMYLGDLVTPDGFGVGDESLAVDLFREEDIPWNNLAFRIVEEALRRYYRERQAGEFTVGVSDLR